MDRNQAVRTISLEKCEDDELVSQSKKRNELAIRELIRRNNQLLYRICRSVLRNDADAEDAVQDTYLRAFTHLDQFTAAGSFSSWLARIAYNSAISKIRKRRHDPAHPGSALDHAAIDSTLVTFPGVTRIPDPEESMRQKELRQVLEACVDELDEEFRLVFVMREIHGLSTKETASLLSLKAPTVKTRLHRARATLRKSLMERIGQDIGSLYPFNGSRCANLADRVISNLNAQLLSYVLNSNEPAAPRSNE